MVSILPLLALATPADAAHTFGPFSAPLVSAAEEAAANASETAEEADEPWLGDFYLEYMRGKSLPTTSDLRLKFGNTDVRYHGLEFGDRSFHPDGGVIPNVFLRKLGEGEFRNAVASFTEPYYGVRLYYFFRSMPDWGIGIDFIHFKVFIDDLEQVVRKTGSVNGTRVDEMRRIGDDIHSFNVSHGVNHLSFAVVYRRRFLESKMRPDGLFQPFVSLAVGPTIPHPELFFKDAQGGAVPQANGYQLEASNFGFTVGTGLRMRLHPNWAFVMEYKFSYSYLHGMTFDNDPKAEIDMDFIDSHFQWGIAIVI